MGDGKKTTSMAWLLGQVGGHKREYVWSVILAIVGVGFSIVPYFFAIKVINGFMRGEKNIGFYLRYSIFMAIFWSGRVLFHALSTSTSHRATFAVLGEMRKRCIEKLAHMPLGVVLDRGTGSLKNILIERIDSIETTLAHIVPEVTANLLIPFAVLIYIFIIDWRMGLASLLTIPMGMVCYSFMIARSDKFYQKTVEATKALNDTAVEYIHGIQVIKVFGKTKSSYERFSQDAYNAAHSFIDWMYVSIFPMTLMLVIMPATMLSVLPIGGILVKLGSLSSVNFISIIILSVGLITPLITAASYSDDISKMGTILEEVRDILEAEEMERPLQRVEIKRRNIALKNVHFRYKDKEVLHGISMDIPEGSFIALVGPSGSGKSTIARLIASLWDINEGKIELGGMDIRQIPQKIYTDQIAYVSQDNYLFNMTVRENIRLGRQSATDEEVEEVAKKSGCHDFIIKLENGYDTMAGSSHLSGGEKQRICIARAMLKAAPIVILDEATAYTDPENEAIIQRAVSKLTEKKTLIVIAHRLSTIVDADKIYVIRKGEIEESGTHSELLKHHGLYESMWKAHMEVKDNA